MRPFNIPSARTLAAVAVCALALTGAAVAGDAPLAGDWQVEDIAGGGIIDNSNLTLAFGEDGRLAGSAGCNNYSAAYAVTDDTLSVGPVVATRKLCPEALMSQEARFLGVLGDVARYETDATAALLLYTDASDEPALVARRR